MTPVGSAEVVENLRIAELECWKIILHLNGKVMRKMQKQSGRDRKFYFFFLKLLAFSLIHITRVNTYSALVLVALISLSL